MTGVLMTVVALSNQYKISCLKIFFDQTPLLHLFLFALTYAFPPNQVATQV
jgi:hypothetical protein